MTRSTAGIIFLITIFGALFVANSEEVKDLKIIIAQESLACDKRAQPGDIVTVHYTGKLQNGEVRFLQLEIMPYSLISPRYILRSSIPHVHAILPLHLG